MISASASINLFSQWLGSPAVSRRGHQQQGARGQGPQLRQQWGSHRGLKAGCGWRDNLPGKDLSLFSFFSPTRFWNHFLFSYIRNDPIFQRHVDLMWDLKVKAEIQQVFEERELGYLVPASQDQGAGADLPFGALQSTEQQQEIEE